MDNSYKERQSQLFAHVYRQYPALQPLHAKLEEAFQLLCRCFQQGGTVLTCGNGGSAADSEHIVGELMKGFLLKRPLNKEQLAAIAKTGCPDPEGFAAGLQNALPAIALTSQTALLTAYMNDVSADMIFAQQVFAYGKEGDLLIALSTSGNAQNVVNGAIAARAKGMQVLALTGEKESKLSAQSHLTIQVPATETYKIQEYHLPIYHLLCGLVELQLFEQ